MRDFEYYTDQLISATRNQAVHEQVACQRESALSGAAINQRNMPEQVPMLDEFASRVRNATAHAALILDRLSCLGDRVYGSQPEASSTGEKAGISQEGAVDRVFCALSDLDRTLAALEHAENRIHGLA